MACCSSFGLAPTNWFRFLLEIIFVLLVIHSVRKTRKDFLDELAKVDSISDYMAMHGWVYTLFEWLGITLNVTVILLWLVYCILPSRRSLSGNPDDYVTYQDLSALASWEHHYVGVNALNVILQTIRSLRFFQILPSGERLVVSLQAMTPQLASLFQPDEGGGHCLPCAVDIEHICTV